MRATEMEHHKINKPSYIHIKTTKREIIKLPSNSMPAAGAAVAAQTCMIQLYVAVVWFKVEVRQINWWKKWQVAEK